MAGVTRLKLNSISPGSTHFMVVGIIIGKQNPKVIVSKKGNQMLFESNIKSVYQFSYL